MFPFLTITEHAEILLDTHAFSRPDTRINFYLKIFSCSVTLSKFIVFFDNYLIRDEKNKFLFFQKLEIEKIEQISSDFEHCKNNKILNVTMT